MPLSDAHINALRTQKEVDLSSQDLVDLDWSMIRIAIEVNPDLKKLDLSRNKLSHIPAYIFKKMALHPSLAEVNLTGNVGINKLGSTILTCPLVQSDLDALNAELLVKQQYNLFLKACYKLQSMIDRNDASWVEFWVEFRKIQAETKKACDKTRYLQASYYQSYANHHQLSWLLSQLNALAHGKPVGVLDIQNNYEFAFQFLAAYVESKAFPHHIRLINLDNSIKLPTSLIETLRAIFCKISALTIHHMSGSTLNPETISLFLAALSQAGQDASLQNFSLINYDCEALLIGVLRNVNTKATYRVCTENENRKFNLSQNSLQVKNITLSTQLLTEISNALATSQGDLEIDLSGDVGNTAEEMNGVLRRIAANRNLVIGLSTKPINLVTLFANVSANVTGISFSNQHLTPQYVSDIERTVALLPLDTFELDSCDVSEEVNLDALAITLNRSRQLRHLHLSNIRCKSAEQRSVFNRFLQAILANPVNNLESLNIDHNELEPETIVQLSTYLRNCALRKLSIQGIRLIESDVAQLKNAMRNNERGVLREIHTTLTYFNFTSIAARNNGREYISVHGLQDIIAIRDRIHKKFQELLAQESLSGLPATTFCGPDGLVALSLCELYLCPNIEPALEIFERALVKFLSVCSEADAETLRQQVVSSSYTDSWQVTRTENLYERVVDALLANGKETSALKWANDGACSVEVKKKLQAKVLPSVVATFIGNAKYEEAIALVKTIYSDVPTLPEQQNLAYEAYFKNTKINLENSGIAFEHAFTAERLGLPKAQQWLRHCYWAYYQAFTEVPRSHEFLKQNKRTWLPHLHKLDSKPLYWLPASEEKQEPGFEGKLEWTELLMTYYSYFGQYRQSAGDELFYFRSNALTRLLNTDVRDCSSLHYLHQTALIIILKSIIRYDILLEMRRYYAENPVRAWTTGSNPDELARKFDSTNDTSTWLKLITGIIEKNSGLLGTPEFVVTLSKYRKLLEAAQSYVQQQAAAVAPATEMANASASGTTLTSHANTVAAADDTTSTRSVASSSSTFFPSAVAASKAPEAALTPVPTTAAAAAAMPASAPNRARLFPTLSALRDRLPGTSQAHAYEDSAAAAYSRL